MSACVNGGHYLHKMAADAKLPGCDQLSIASAADTREVWATIAQSCAVSEIELARLVAARFHIELADLEGAEPTASKLIPASLANQYQVFPLVTIPLTYVTDSGIIYPQ